MESSDNAPGAGPDLSPTSENSGYESGAESSCYDVDSSLSKGDESFLDSDGNLEFIIRRKLGIPILPELGQKPENIE